MPAAAIMRLYCLLIAAGVLVLDQVTKKVVLAQFSPETIVPVVPGWFRLVLVENTGMAFGLGSDSSSPWVSGALILLSVVGLAFVGYMLWSSDPSDRRTAVGLSLILGGACGNLADRLLRGSVVDFLDFYVGSYHWPVFNVADSAIVVGAGLFLLDLLRGRSRVTLERASSSNR